MRSEIFDEMLREASLKANHKEYLPVVDLYKDMQKVSGIGAQERWDEPTEVVLYDALRVRLLKEGSCIRWKQMHGNRIDISAILTYKRSGPHLSSIGLILHYDARTGQLLNPLLEKPARTQSEGYQLSLDDYARNPKDL